ncbi:MAG: SMC-Scp complex subunit ScpB [bacterium]
MELNQIKNRAESLLFISHKPLSVKELTKLLEVNEAEMANALMLLEQEYVVRAGGIQLMKLEDKYQMTTAGDSAEVVGKFIKSEMTGELTKPSLETLTIIAYRGPVSKAELEVIRGVNCSMILRNLLMRGMIEGKEDVARGITLYSVTFDFLKYLGLNKLTDLPDYEKLNRNNNLSKLLEGTISNAVMQKAADNEDLSSPVAPESSVSEVEPISNNLSKIE